MSAGGETRLHRAVFMVSFAISALLSLWLAFESADWGFACLFFGASLVVVPMLMRGLVRRGHSIDWVLAVAALNLFVVVPELGLRLGGFSYESGIQFGYPRPSKMIAFEPDAELFWRLPSSDPEVNSLGFPGPEVARPKPANTFRILFLGDSCTYQRYPRLVKTVLLRRPEPELDVEVVNLGVPGYSSHQGRVIAETRADALDPDLVFVHYGWNDHWLAYGTIDAEKRVEAPTGLRATRPVRELSNLRLFQLGRKLRTMARSQETDLPLDRVRVPAAQYRENLRAIQRHFAARGVPVVFVTAPTSHHVLGVPAYLLEQGFAADVPSVVRVHREYIRMTRQVAGESGAGLFDLAAIFNEVGDPEKYFLADGIHFTRPGLELIARRIARAVQPLLAEAEARSPRPTAAN